MRNQDWRLPSSETEKMRLIKEKWRNDTPREMWFLLGDITRLSPDAIWTIRSKCYNGHNLDKDVFLRVKKSNVLPGRPIIMILKGKLRVLPSLTLDGTYCPLYRVGQSDAICEDLNFIDFSVPPQDNGWL